MSIEQEILTMNSMLIMGVLNGYPELSSYYLETTFREDAFHMEIDTNYIFVVYTVDDKQMVDIYQTEHQSGCVANPYELIDTQTIGDEFVEEIILRTINPSHY